MFKKKGSIKAQVDTVVKSHTDIRGESWQKVHENSRDFYYHFWKENSKYTTIEKLMFNEKINYDDPGCKNNRVVE